MTTLKQLLRKSAWMVLFLVAVAYVLTPQKARAQYSAPVVDQCSTQTADSTNNVEITVCISGDSTGLSAYASPSGGDGMYVSGTGAELQVYDGGYQFAVSSTELFDSGFNGTNWPSPSGGSDSPYYSWVPVINKYYWVTGIAWEYYIPDGSGEPQDGWWTESGSTETWAQVTPAPIQGYIDPKYIVLGVTYAPPGPSSFVTNTDSQAVATTVSLANSFTNSTTYSVSLGFTVGSTSGTVPGVKGGVTITNSDTATQTTKDTRTVTLNWSTANTIKTFGTANAFSPVDNDYDMVYVWLNPVELFTVSDNNVTWNGFGYDANDQNGMDIVAIPLGYLNGDFGSMPPDILASTNRSWANNVLVGPNPALTNADFAQIASYDPFSVSAYGPIGIGYVPPVPNTADGRFTLTTCNSNNSVQYTQADPSETPETYTCTVSYSNLTSTAQDITTSSSTTYSLDESFTVGDKFFTITQDFKFSSTQTTTTETNHSISSTQSTSSLASITGVPCGNKVAYVGPCVPVYDASGNQPTEFNIYQDNMYGTFMFAPVHYYPTVAATPPIGNLDEAVDSTTGSSTVSSADSVLIAGWAADAADGSQLARVTVYVDGSSIGTPITWVARPDVAAYFSNPAYYYSGYQYPYPVSGLSAGQHTVTVTAVDTFGLSTTFGPLTFTVE
jgi:hypothetical protein